MAVRRDALVAYYRDVLGWTDREAREQAAELFAPVGNPDNVQL